MKTGKSLTDMAKELEEIRKTAKDYVAPVEKLAMTVLEKDDGKGGKVVRPLLDIEGGKILTPNKWAHSQIATFTDIPKTYYDRIAVENARLLKDNVNHGLRKQHGKSRMLRTVGNTLRAMLSAKYRCLDSYDMMNAVLPDLIDHKFDVVSCELTEQRFYLKAVTKRIQAEVKKGDVVQFGLVASSSDVGAGSVRIEPLIYQLVCLNGLILPTAIRKAHLGRNLAGDDVYELLTDETKDMTDAAFWAQIRDVLRASMEPARFQAEVAKLSAAANEKIENFNIPEVVELATRTVGVHSVKTNENIVAFLANGANGAGLTKWGLISGITWAAQQEHVDYDTSVEMERAASSLLTLPEKKWRQIAEKH